MLPNFLIIGSPRSGTSYLYQVLDQHPDIFLAKNRYTGDILFFNPSSNITRSKTTNWEKGIGWYESLFAEVKDEKAVGEKTALYFSDPEAPKLIKSVIPNIRLIVTLRNPIERAFSAYKYHFGEIPKGMRFIDACKAESIKRIKFIEAGLYNDHYLNYMKYFNKNQFLFILQDYLHTDSLTQLKSIFNFLNVDEKFIPDNYTQIINRSIGKESGITYYMKFLGGNIKQNLHTLYRV